VTEAIYIGHSVEQALRRAMNKHGAGEAELAAIDRLARFEGWQVDIDRLKPLAKLAGLPDLWREGCHDLQQ